MLLPAAALARPEAARPRLQPVHGVTPGGLVYQVNPAARRLSLRTPLGAEVGSFPMQPEERMVAGVADDGSRVTLAFRGEPPSDDGMTEGRPARFVFRDSSGNITATHRIPLRSNASPVVFGAEVFSVSREKDAYVLLGTSASAPDAPVGRVDAATLTREVGRLGRISIHASSAGVIVEFVGAVTTIYFDPAASGRLVRPDATLSCGNASQDQVFSWSGGVARFTSRFERTDHGFQKKGDVEWLDRAGSLVRATELGELRELFPLPGGQLLALDEIEARVLDDRGGVLSRAAFSTEEGVDPVHAERAAAALRRMERLGGKASGADWVDAAIAANGEGERFAPIAGRDPWGVLNRLAREPDGSADLEAARIALAMFLGSRGFERSLESRTDSAPKLQKRWDEVIRTVEENVARGVPRWFKTQVAFAVLAARRERSPAWVTLAAAGAIAAGETAALSNLPEEAFNPELAELTLALDRDRMDRLQREDPELSGDMLWTERSMDSDRDAESLRFHVPPRRFVAALLACLPEAGPIRFQAVIEALGALGVESRAASRAQASGLDEASSAPAPPVAPVDLGDIASLLL
ncbi:MAG: hypothetical protein ABIT01_17050, partial [Thermoanaerobaculia bacterium]